MTGRRGKMEDRLSNLPHHLLLNILSFLETKEVVQTSVLSRRWRDIWTEIPTLDFDFYSFRNDSSFPKFVNHVLLHRYASTNLQKFKIYCPADLSTLKKVMNYLILHGHGIQNLSLCAECYLSKMSLFWTHLCSWKSLTILRLQLLKIPINLHLDFIALTTLTLIDCNIVWHGGADSYPEKGSFKISAPQLTYLWISWMGFDYDDIVDLKVILSTPNLSFFSFVGHQLFDLSIPKHPLLREVYVHYCNESDDEYEIDHKYLFNMLGELGNARSVTLAPDTVYLLSEVPNLLEGKISHCYGVEEFKVTAQGYTFTMPTYVVDYLLSTFPSSQSIVVDGWTIYTEDEKDFNGSASENFKCYYGCLMSKPGPLLMVFCLANHLLRKYFEEYEANTYSDG